MKKIILTISFLLLAINIKAQSDVLIMLMSEEVNNDTTFIIDDGFTTSSCGVEWTCQASWTIGSGVASYDGSGLEYILNASVPLSSGVTYILIIRLVNVPAGGAVFSLFNVNASANLLGSYKTVYLSAVYTYEFTPAANTTGVRFYANTSAANWDLDYIKIYAK